MKVAVIGAGALGSLFGGLLAADGNEVALLHHRESVAAAIERRGVVIEAPEGEERRVDVESTVDAAEFGPAELAIVLVKSHQTIPAVDQHDACIGADTRVLSLQNGLTNHHRLRDHIGADRTLHGVTYQGAVSTGPGRVRRTSDGPSIFGGSDTSFANRVGTVLDAADVEATVVDDPVPAIWEKQLVGVATKPLAALTRLRNGELVADDRLADAMYRLMAEAAQVADERGVRLDVESTYDELTTALAGSDHPSSMLQDVDAGRRTEIDDVNGAIVELGDAHGVDVPANELVTAMVRGLERGYLDADR